MSSPFTGSTKSDKWNFGVLEMQGNSRGDWKHGRKLNAQKKRETRWEARSSVETRAWGQVNALRSNERNVCWPDLCTHVACIKQSVGCARYDDRFRTLRLIRSLTLTSYCEIRARSHEARAPFHSPRSFSLLIDRASPLSVRFLSLC